MVFKIIYILPIALIFLINIVFAQSNPIDSLQPGQWYEVPNSKIRSVVPNPLPPGDGPQGITGAWSGGAYDTKRDRLIVWGGGHGDYGGNELYTFDINTLKWTRIWGPTNVSLIPPAIPPSNCSETYSDGNPRSRHTYGGLQYLPNIDRFWNSGGSLYCGSGGASPGTWTFNFDTLTWERKANFIGYAELEHVSAYDPVTGRVFFVNTAAPLHQYDPITDTWSKLTDMSIGNYKMGTIDPKRRKFVIVGDGVVYTYDLPPKTDFSRKTVSTIGATEIINGARIGIVYDPVIDRLVAWNGEADVYSLNLDNLVWTKIPPAPSNTVIPTAATATGTYGRFQYIPSKNAFIVVNSIDENVFIYKLSSNASSLPPDTVAPTISSIQANSISSNSATIIWQTNEVSDSQVEYGLTTGYGTSTSLDTNKVTSHSINLNGLNSNTLYHYRIKSKDASNNLAASGDSTFTTTASTPTGQINIPSKIWIALDAPLPFSNKGIPPTNKHVSPAYHPSSGRIYFNGGDYAGGGSYDNSYRQETWSLSIAERFANKSDRTAGWRLEYPYCGPTGQIQPKHPDYTGFVWDSKRELFYMVPGVMESTTGVNCPGETMDKANNPGFITGKMMSFNPVTKTWQIVGDIGPDSQDTWMAPYDPVTDTIIRFGLSLKVNIYDVKTGTWTAFGGVPNHLWKEYLAIDVPGRAVYGVAGFNGKLYKYNIDAKTFEDLGSVPEGGVGLDNLAHVAWDSLNGILYYYRLGISNLYAYHPDTRTWETLPLLTDIPSVSARGRLLVYDPGQNVLLLLGGVDTDTDKYIFLYRYAKSESIFDSIPPSQVTSLTATPVSSSQINLNWNPATDNLGVYGYKIYRNNVEIATSSTNYYNDFGLTASTAYNYKIAAYDAAGNIGIPSTQISATTLSSIPIVTATEKTILLQDELNGYSGTRDAYIYSWNSNTNYGSSTELQSSAVEKFNILVGFKIYRSEGGPIPNNATIKLATLSLYKFTSYDFSANAKRLLKDWKENEATWNNANSLTKWSTPGADGTSDILVSENSNGWVGWNPDWINFDVTKSVQDFSSTANYGWKIVSSSNDQNTRKFYSREYTDTTLRPKLTITYVELQTTNIAIKGDVNNDGSVDLLDLLIIVKDFGKTTGFDSKVDIAAPFGVIDIFDIMGVVMNLGKQ